jgi:hypothetical protein
MAVARTAYAVLWEASSYRSFIRALQLQHINGVYLGDLQHDRGPMPKFLNAAHDEVRFRMKKFMHTVTAATGRKPVFSLAADKPTLLKRNSQAVVLFAPLVTEHGGIDVAKTNQVRLGFTDADWKRSSTAMAFDGAYFKIYVHTHLPTSTSALQAASPRCFALLCGVVPTALSWVFSTYTNSAPPNSEHICHRLRGSRR